MKSSSLSFNNFGLGGKLVSIVAVTTIIMISILMGISSYAVTDILESTTKKEMHLDNEVVIGMLNLIEKSRKQQTENTIKSLNTEFNGKFTIDGSKINLDDKVLPNLFYEGESISGNTSLVKSTSVRTSELVAILAKSGDEFVWVSSTYKEEKGGLGTVLDRNHPIFTALNSGDSYFGSQTLFGKNYLSRYQPIKNSTGQVIGAFLSAIDVSDQVSMLKEEVKTLKIGNEGYVYIMEGNGKDVGKLLVHPTSEGKNLADIKDSNGFYFVKDMIKNRNGDLRYMWINQGEDIAKEKIALYNTHDGFGWIIVSCGYVNDIFSRVSKERWFIIIPGVILNILFCLGFYSVVQRFIVSPLNEAAHLAERVAHGDLTIHADDSRHDEVGRLLHSINGIGQGLSGIVGKVREAAESITMSSGEITSGNHNLSMRTEQGAANLEHTASSLEQLTTMVKQNAENATIASKLANQASDVAARGGEAVSHVVETMEDINASSKKINEITSVIDGIAFQTNILALNAAVEAARAGEQGRGFAVVASEVRSLAQRSAEAAKEIKGLIELSTGKIEMGYTIVEEAGKTIQDVVKQSKEVQALITEISSATDEQSQGLDVINQAIAQIDETTQQNAALAEQGSAAAQSLKDQAGNLVTIVSTFRLA